MKGILRNFLGGLVLTLCLFVAVFTCARADMLDDVYLLTEYRHAAALAQAYCSPRWIEKCNEATALMQAAKPVRERIDFHALGVAAQSDLEWQLALDRLLEASDTFTRTYEAWEAKARINGWVAQ